MIECQRCGTQSPEGFRFCPACGAELPAAAAPPTAALEAPSAKPVEQRRIVTALFCDLVGFTATSEQADPEDVDRMLSAYGAMARTEIERHGGTIEKFIGDAVVGVFGIPIAHEDDALRAVRAGLDITRRATELTGPGDAPLRLRVGINTGEVLARMDIEARSGERFLAGDAINTASRIQSAAPEMGVAVGIESHEATRSAIDYQELEPVSLKGKSEPVRIFHAEGVKARTGVEATPSTLGAYVGRVAELAQLQILLSETAADTPVSLATIIGEAGMGKSRLLVELRAELQRTHRYLTWRQGRCLPYGEGITFWALGEIVKAQAGILESDPESVVRAKLAGAIATGPDAAWVHERLLPLVGVEAAQVTREESFAAWRAFLEGLAVDGPAVVVIEDLHWADESLLAFLEDAAREAKRGPLLLLTTARPEFLRTHPDFATELANAHRLELEPLSAQDTTAMVASLFGSFLPEELAGPIVERAEGNPLYAEEYVALLRDRDLLVVTDGVVSLRHGLELPVPTSIHALLAARLDTLAAEPKSLLTDAAVVGKIFWDGVLVAMDGKDRTTVDATLTDLAGQSFVRQNPESTMAGEEEFSFWHMLGRDVAYRQLPRGSRASRHAAAATWLEAKLGDRADDVADVLADHWRNALELSRAAGQAGLADSYEPKAIHYLVRAGDRARGLDTAAATARYEAALALTPPGHADRPDILLRFGSTAYHQLRFDEAIAALDEAIAASADDAQWQRRGRAMLARMLAIWETGDAAQNLNRATWLDDLLALLEAHEPTPELVDVLTERGIDRLTGSRQEEAISTLDRALAVAGQLNLPVPGRTLGFRGEARLALGDYGGMDDLRASGEIARGAGRGRDLVIATVNTGTWQTAYVGADTGVRTVQEAIELGQRFGYVGLSLAMRHLSVQLLVDAGQIDEATSVMDALLRDETRRSPSTVLARIHALRGEEREAMEGVRMIEAEVLPIVDTDERVLVRARLAEIHSMFNQHQAAVLDIEDVLAIENRVSTDNYGSFALPFLARAACRAGRVDLAERILAEARALYPLSKHARAAALALVSEHRGQVDSAADGHRDAARGWASFTRPIEEAHAHIGHARCMVAMGRQSDAAAPLATARTLCERMSLLPMLAEIAALEATASRAAPAG